MRRPASQCHGGSRSKEVQWHRIAYCRAHPRWQWGRASMCVCVCFLTANLDLKGSWGQSTSSSLGRVLQP